MKIHTYYFIINPHSGSRKNTARIVSLIKTRFKEIDFKIVFTEFAGHASALARKAIAAKFDVIVAVGGDGTLNEVGSALVHSSSFLGLIPRGSGNGFARSLSIPMHINDALLSLLNPRLLTIDVGRVNQNYFMGVAGVGFDAEIARAFQNFGVRGPLPYFYLGTKSFFKYTYPEIKITTNGETASYHPLLITIANTRQFGNGAIIAPKADYLDGLLDICVINRIPARKLPAQVKLLFSAKLDSSPYYYTSQVEKLTIELDKKGGCYHVDGEPQSGVEKLELQVVPKSLKVIIPND